ncbi:GDSL esterase/lipase At1g28570-like [Typha angustifolia]|uniref:GDSL esterase/lipase At1g28570-like n=1 Tax=Typha angustifolia TaxID=59011 RepID=UPI003C2D11EB
MASSSHGLLLLLPIVILPLLQAQLAAACYSRIFCFGDSISDTGNFVSSAGGDWFDSDKRCPYGETYFGRPSGRFTDGRVIVDFIAQAFGLPFLTAYLEGRCGEDFRHGANFAVMGATALNNSFFAAKGMNVTWTDYSLGVQMQWFMQLLPLLSPGSSDYNNIMSTSLFIVGEIGGNDYNHPLLDGSTSFDEVLTFVPPVVHYIISSITDLIKLGAKTFVVPGNFPIGCIPSYLKKFQSQNEEDYDPQTGCIKWLNEFAEYHNKLLVEELDNLKKLYPNVTIIYADYYEAVIRIFRDPNQFGFKAPLQACCGTPASSVCDDPSSYGSWDGMHPTEAVYNVVADGVLHGPYAIPYLANTCPENNIIGDNANSLQYVSM